MLQTLYNKKRDYTSTKTQVVQQEFKVVTALFVVYLGLWLAIAENKFLLHRCFGFQELDLLLSQHW